MITSWYYLLENKSVLSPSLFSLFLFPFFLSLPLDDFCLFLLSREDFDQEEKARFGELCSGESGSKGREWFARYVTAQVCEDIQ